MNPARISPLHRLCAVLAITMCLGAVSASLAQGTNVSRPDLQGDPGRGEQLYTNSYRCYSCHGYDAQSGERRLKPLRFTQAAFIQFVRNSPLPRMPAYAAVSERDLVDIFAYLQAIPLDAPEIEQTPLLKEIWTRKLGEFDR